MTVAFYLLFVALFLPVQEEDEYIEWNPFYRLQWHDFRAEPAMDAVSDAGTAIKISAMPYRVRKRIHYDVVALFNRDKSWVRDSSMALLEHERLHFDIAELYARKIRKRIDELRARGEDDIDVLNAEIRALLRESNRVDMRYDVETLHGAMSEKQSEWNRQVRRELEDLKRFVRKRRVVGGP